MRALSLAMLVSSATAAADVCLPSPSAASREHDDPDRPEHYNINNHLGRLGGRLGGRLAICQRSKDQHPVGCWSVDAETGALAPLTDDALPGTGVWRPGPCYRGTCWGDRSSGEVFVAANPDGKRIAAIDGGELIVFDLVKAKVTSRFSVPSWTDLWFVGDALYLRNDDAGPGSQLHVHTLAGAETATYTGVYYGAVAVDRGAVMVNEVVNEVDDGKMKLTILGRTGAKAGVVRAASPRDLDGAELLRDGGGYLGLRYGALLRLDGKLRIHERIAIRRCPPAPDRPDD